MKSSASRIPSWIVRRARVDVGRAKIRRAAVCVLLLGAVVVGSASGVRLRAGATSASVRVAVANVWALPGVANLGSDPNVWPTAALTYSERLAIEGKLVTHALFDEQVTVISRSGEWTRIVIPDQPTPLDPRGYPGWIRTSDLGSPLPGGPHTVTVAVPRAALSNHLVISFATRLPVVGPSEGTSIRVRTPMGTAFVHTDAVRTLPRTRSSIVATATTFLGLRYLWGGTSAWGFDCSGFVWALYRAHGITIPRDADAQFAAGRPTTLDRAREGDLVFYGQPHVDHVALYLVGGMMIESPDSADTVRVIAVRDVSLAGVRSFMP